MPTAPKTVHTPGSDRYGYFVIYNHGTAKEFRSAMPDAETAKCAAASHDLLAACRRAKMEITTDDARHFLARRYGEAGWMETVDLLTTAIARATV